MFRKNDVSSEVIRLREQVDQLQRQSEKLDAAIERLDQVYVRFEEFSTVKNVVFGAVGMILIAVLGGVLVTIGL